MSAIYLGINIDHVATLRQARGTYYPEPVHAALLAEQFGADGITVHLQQSLFLFALPAFASPIFLSAYGLIDKLISSCRMMVKHKRCRDVNMCC